MSSKEVVKKEIEKYSNSLVTARKVKDESRRNELKTTLRITLIDIAARIDRGMRIDGAAEELEDGEDAGSDVNNAIVREIQEKSNRIKYFEPEAKPILELEVREEQESSD